MDLRDQSSNDRVGANRVLRRLNDAAGDYQRDPRIVDED
jgi:hypothetical protein